MFSPIFQDACIFFLFFSSKVGRLGHEHTAVVVHVRDPSALAGDLRRGGPSLSVANASTHELILNGLPWHGKFESTRERFKR